MTTYRPKLNAELIEQITENKPKHIGLTAFLNMLLNDGLDRWVYKQKICDNIYNNKDNLQEGLEPKENKEKINKKETKEKVIGVFPEDLEKFKDYMNEFWKVKKGAKTKFSWKLQLAECKKIKDKYGDKVLTEQLKAGALAGGWKGLSLINYERINNINNGTTATQNEPKGQGQNLFIPADWQKPDYLSSGVN